MTTQSLTIDQVLSLLAAAPPRFAALTTGLAPGQLHSAPFRVSGPSMRCSPIFVRALTFGAIALQQSLPKTGRRCGLSIPGLGSKAQAISNKNLSSRFTLLLCRRADLLAVLAPLPPDAWLRTATITGAGTPLVRTVHSYTQWLARHERPHIKQVERITNILRE